MVCLIIGKVVEGNSVKSYVVMNENGSTQLVKRVSIFKFCRDNDVLNVTVSKNSLTGKGVMLSNIPKYKDTGIFGMQQVGGMSQEEVMQLAQPYIEQYRQNKQRKQSKQNSSNDKSKQEQYVMSKIDIIELLINCALQMKNITNEMASNGDFTRYIKQIDIDNAEGDSLDNLIKRQGVNGLAKGLLDRLNRLKNRVKKFGLHKNLLVMIEHLEKECEQLKKLHSETKQIIKQNKDKESIEEKENRQLECEAESENIDDIPVVEDAHIDAIEIDTSDKYIQNIDDIFGDIPVVEDVHTNAIEVEYSKSSEITSIDDIFKSSTNKERTRDRINALADLRNIFSNEIVYQAFSISNRYKGLTDYNTELDRLEKSFNEGEIIISYINNESLHMSADMSVDVLREIGSRYNIIYNDIKNQIKGIKQKFRGSAFDLKDNPYHPGDFINYMYCIHSAEIESQTESMCNNGGWDFVTARSNARLNVINSYYTDDNTRTYYDLCNEIIKNFCNLHG